MMLERMIEVHPPVTMREVHAFAKRHGLHLPHAYHRFLIRYNGGRPVPDTFTIQKLPINNSDSINMFYGIGAEEEIFNLDETVEFVKGLFPEKLLPVANTPSNNEICIDLRKKGAPVVLWDRGAIWRDHVWKEDQLFPVADNFEAFLRSLSRHPDD